jgi:hypothetical protein
MQRQRDDVRCDAVAFQTFFIHAPYFKAMKRAFINLGLSATLALLAACAGGSSAPPAGAIAPPVQSGNRTAPFEVAPNALQKVVFIADLSGSVNFFSANINVKNPPLLGQITQGTPRPEGVWVDKNGTLYVSNDAQPPSIAEFKRGSKTPFKTITSGLDTPGEIAVDSSGNLYVADFGFTVLVYPPGASTPSRTIAIPNQMPHHTLGSMAFDSQGDLLVAEAGVEGVDASVYSVAPGSSQAVNLNLQGLAGAQVGTDRAGNIYNGSDEGAIVVYAPGSKTPSRSIYAGTNGFYSFFTVTPNGTIYWPNYDDNEMYEFAPGASGPTNVFNNGGGVDAAIGLW